MHKRHTSVYMCACVHLCGACTMNAVSPNDRMENVCACMDLCQGRDISEADAEVTRLKFELQMEKDAKFDTMTEVGVCTI